MCTDKSEALIATLKKTLDAMASNLTIPVEAQSFGELINFLPADMRDVPSEVQGRIDAWIKSGGFLGWYRARRSEQKGTIMYRDLLVALDALRESLEDLPEAKLDTEALLRVELANHLAAAARVLSALAADEEK